MSYLQRKARQARIAERGRKTAQSAESFERVLICVRCGALERVFEAATHGPQEWIEPGSFLCWGCLAAPVADAKPFLTVIAGTRVVTPETSGGSEQVVGDV